MLKVVLFSLSVYHLYSLKLYLLKYQKIELENTLQKNVFSPVWSFHVQIPCINTDCLMRDLADL